ISFSGIITFKNAADLREVVKQVPIDRLLIETDSPYLAPVPYRGKPNQPIYVRQVAECVAEIKNMSIEEVAQVTSDNYYHCFPLAIR
ncbi:MAG: TatD family hydrolase, partial [Candidatus Thiodiazotropha sp. 4PDIVS1]